MPKNLIRNKGIDFEEHWEKVRKALKDLAKAHGANIDMCYDKYDETHFVICYPAGMSKKYKSYAVLSRYLLIAFAHDSNDFVEYHREQLEYFAKEHDYHDYYETSLRAFIDNLVTIYTDY